MSRRTSAWLIAAAVLVAGCADAQADPTSAYTPVSGPWRPVVVPESTPAVSASPEAFWAPMPPPEALPTPKATRRPASPPPKQPSIGAHRLAGLATWYAYVPGGAAAGPVLRAALGPHWRGRVVSVCVGSRCEAVTLSDWCACGGGRTVDLDVRSFAALADPSRGILPVTIRW